ncbi:MAG: HNH endonuclease, partial [Candidatus Methylomirabilis sp.]|nr:HNH endonuclease [Deltaproteobacteria bacterium]
RLQVMNAYGHRCAVTGLQLKIVEAAHVLPVAAPGSVDDVRNGIALSPTYHKAYDRGLIYLGPDYRMRLNSTKAERLIAEGLEGGLGALEGSLSRIFLPQDRRQWPDPKLIRKANAFRGISP